MIDDFDRKLILELERDGRKTNVDLARSLQTTESTIRKRIKRLLKEGIIRIAAIPNIHKLGYNYVGIMCLQVRMADLKQVAETLSQKQNVHYLAFVTGRYDMIAMVVFRTLQELSDFIKEEISVIPGILRSETFDNLEIIKSFYKSPGSAAGPDSSFELLEHLPTSQP